MRGLKKDKTERGFQCLTALPPDSLERVSVVQESSAIGPREEDLVRPGSSFLWIGPWSEHVDRPHLDRVAVAGLRDALTRWLDTGELYEPEKEQESE
jgi:hypothetical protein